MKVLVLKDFLYQLDKNSRLTRYKKDSLVEIRMTDFDSLNSSGFVTSDLKNDYSNKAMKTYENKKSKK